MKLPYRYNPEYVAGAPPKEYWLIKDGEKIDTPVDERGFVDVPKLIVALGELIVPEYVWQGWFNKHHLLWMADLYPDEDILLPGGAVVNLKQARSVPPNCLWAPRDFECFLHAVTVPPTRPGVEELYWRAESWRVARELFSRTKLTRSIEKKRQKRTLDLVKNGHFRLNLGESEEVVDTIGDEYFATQTKRHFDSVQQLAPKLERIPEEFRLVDVECKPEEVLRTVGSFISYASQRLELLPVPA